MVQISPLPTSCSASFLVLSSLLLVLVVWYLLSFVPRWLWCLELMVPLKRVVFHFLVSVAHAFFNRMGTVFLLTCLVVGRLGIGVREVSVCSRLPVSLCRADGWAACHCSQFTHFRVRFLLSLHWFDACLPAQYLHVLAWCPNVWQLNHCSGSLTKGLIRKLPYPLVNLSECCSIPVLLLPCLWVPTFVFPYSTWSS